MATKEIYEEKVWEIKGKPSSGVWKDKEVKLIFVEVDDAGKEREIFSIPQKVEDEGFSYQYQTQKVGAGKANSKLSAYAEYTWSALRDRKKLPDDCIVWPAQYKITAKDEDGNKVTGFEFTAKQGTDDLPSPSTNEEGESTLDLKKNGGEVTITAKPPYEILEQTKPTGKLREVNLKVKRNRIPEFIAPKPSDDGSAHKQYVNLTSASSGQDFKGDEIEIEVGMQGGGKKDDVIFIQAKFGRESKRNDPAPELLNAESIDKSDEKLQTGQVKLAADNGTAKFKIKLGYAGGDTCEIRLSGIQNQFADGPNVPVLKYVNWRKLSYEIIAPTFMAGDMSGAQLDKMDFPVSIKTKFTEYLKPAFIEYEVSKSHLFNTDGVDLKGVVTSEFIEKPAGRKRYIYGDGWVEESGVAFDAANTTRMRMRLWDAAISGDENNMHEPEVTSADHEHNLGSSYYLKYKPADGAAAPVNITAFDPGWKVVFPDPNAYIKTVTLEVATAEVAAASDSAKERTVTVEDLDHGHAAIDIVFKKTGLTGHIPTALSPTESAKITNLVTSLLPPNNIASLRGNPRLRFKVTGERGNPRREARITAVKTALESEFNRDAARLKVPTHPGLDDAGQPRQGAIGNDWIEHKTWHKVQINLPTADPFDPGSIAGPLSDTKAPIKVRFKMFAGYGINGSAANGKQTMVLRMDEPDGCAQTICHELGHSMGMTITDQMTAPTWLKNAPPGMPPAKHVDNGGPYYVTAYDAPETGGRRKKHTGAHCADGLKSFAVVKEAWVAQTADEKAAAQDNVVKVFELNSNTSIDLQYEADKSDMTYPLLDQIHNFMVERMKALGAPPDNKLKFKLIAKDAGVTNTKRIDNTKTWVDKEFENCKKGWTGAAAGWIAASGTCIMWGEGAKTREKYCDVCISYLKARNLQDIHSSWGNSRSAVDQ